MMRNLSYSSMLVCLWFSLGFELFKVKKDGVLFIGKAGYLSSVGDNPELIIRRNSDLINWYNRVVSIRFWNIID